MSSQGPNSTDRGGDQPKDRRDSTGDPTGQPALPSLARGLTAAQQGNWPVAIAQLQTVVRTADRPSDRVRALMALATAYRRTDQPAELAEILRKLAELQHTQVQTWLDRFQAELPTHLLVQIQARNHTGLAKPTEPNGQASGPDLKPDLAAVGFIPLSDTQLQARPGLELGSTPGLAIRGQAGSPSPSTKTPAKPTSAKPTSAKTPAKPTSAKPASAKASTETPSIETARKSPDLTKDSGANFALLEPTIEPMIEKPDRPSLADRPMLPGVGSIDPATGEPAIEPGPVGDGGPAGDRDEPWPAVWTWVWRNAPGRDEAGTGRTRLAGRSASEPGPAVPWSHYLVQVSLILAVGWVAQQILAGVIAFLNRCLDTLLSLLSHLSFLDWLTGSVSGYYDDPAWLLWLVLVGLAAGSPWLLDEGLKRFFGLKWLKFLDISGRYPQTSRVLQRQARSLNLPMPYFRVLPVAVPIVGAYGSLPQKARLLVSEGALACLSDAELAALLAGELAAIARWDTALLSGLTTILALPYGVYWQSAAAIDHWTLPISRWSAALISVVAYGLFRVGRWLALPLARARIHRSDRAAALATGDPNARTRAIVKLSQGISTSLCQAGHLPPLLEVLELLLPLGVAEVVTIGSLLDTTPIEPVLAWERRQVFRAWFQVNSPQPLLGDRLVQLRDLAQAWNLPPEFDLDDGRDGQLIRAYLADRPPGAKPSDPSRLWLQSAPYLGVVVGVGLGLILWIPGGLGVALRQAWGWMYGDAALLWGLVSLGIGMGGIWRNNAFFPEIAALRLTKTSDRPLGAYLCDRESLPIDGQAVRLTGRLLGRSGLANGLWQDWWLETPSGVIALHLASRFGPIGSFWRQMTAPLRSGQTVIIVGWLRRGAHPWVDVETLATNPRSDRVVALTNWLSPDAHPLRSTILSTIAIAIGLYLLYQGL